MGKIYKRASIPEKGNRFACFVGRKAIIDSFWRDYDSIDQKSDNWDANVINYFGMPGIGKTELANQLYLQHRDKNKNVYSFSFSADNSFLDNMLEFRAGIGEQFKISFPMFDVAVMAYYKRSGRRVEVEKLKLYLDNDIVNALYAIMSLTTFGGVVAAVAQALAPLEKKYKKQFDEDSFAFFRESSETIYSKLAYYFTSDLKDFFAVSKDANTVLVDNAEFFIDNADFKEWFLGEEGLLRLIPNIIWCFFSQREIKDEAELTDKVIRKVQIGALEDEEIREYLIQAGISSDYADKIIFCSEGIPVYLGIIREIYVKKLVNGKLEEFDAELGKEKVIDWYYKQLDGDSKTTLQVLALLETWDDETALATIHSIGISSETYMTLMEHSFIRGTNGRYYLHSLIQDAVINTISEALLKEIKHAIGRIASEELKDQLFFADINAKLNIIDDEEELNRFIVELHPLYDKFRVELDYVRMYKLHHIVTMRARKCSRKIWAESYSYSSYGRLLVFSGLAGEAYNYYSKALMISEGCDKPKYINDRAYRNYQLAIREEYANVLVHLSKFEEANEIREKILDEEIKVNGKKAFETLSAEQNYYQGMVYIDSLRDRAIRGLSKVLSIREKIILKNSDDLEQNKEFKLYAVLSLATGHLRNGDIDSAYERAKEAYEMASSKYGQDDLRTLEAVRVLTNVLMDMKEYGKAFEKLEKLYSEWNGRLKKNSSVIIAVRYALGVSYGVIGNPQKGAELLQENYGILHDLYGRSDKQTLRNKKEYALCLSKMKKHSEAIEHLEDCRFIYIKVYGLDDSEQLKNILHALIVEYSIVGDEEKLKEVATDYLSLGYSLDDFVCVS